MRPAAHHELDSVHRFSDPAYADLTLLMRTGEHSDEVFDTLLQRGQIVLHASEVERTAALAAIGADNSDAYLSLEEAAEAMSVSVKTIRRSAHEVLRLGRAARRGMVSA